MILFVIAGFLNPWVYPMQIREKEANVDNLINPIEDMYSLLMRYEVRVPKEETDMVGDLRYSWKKLRKLSTDVSDNLARLQVTFLALLLCILSFCLVLSHHSAEIYSQDCSCCT